MSTEGVRRGLRNRQLTRRLSYQVGFQQFDKVIDHPVVKMTTRNSKRGSPLGDATGVGPSTSEGRGLGAGELETASKKSSSQSSGRSSGDRVSLSAQIRQVDVEVEEALHSLDLDYTRKRRHLEKEVVSTNNKIKDLNDRIKLFNENPGPQNEDEQVHLKNLDDNLVSLTKEKSLKEEELQTLQEENELQIKDIKMKGEFKKRRLNIVREDVLDQQLDPEDDDRVRNWNAGIDPDLNDDMEDDNMSSVSVKSLPRWSGHQKCYNAGKSTEKPVTVTPECDQLMEKMAAAFGKTLGSKLVIGQTGDRDLPKFNGTATEWPIFKNEFDRTTSDYHISGSQNAIRLRKALLGRAKQAVIGLLDDPNNIDKIMNILEHQFGRPQFILEDLEKAVRESRAPDVNKPATFVEFGEKVLHFIARAKSLGKKYYLYNTTLLQEIVKKLPIMYAEQWLAWVAQNDDGDPNLKLFGNWLEQKMHLINGLCRPVIEESKPKRGSAAVHLTDSIDSKEGIKKCLFCEKSNHYTGSCFGLKKKTFEERFKFAKDKNLCFSCLGKRHPSKTKCNRAKECGINGCTRNHHRYLHKGSDAEDSDDGKDATDDGDPQSTPKQTGESQTQDGMADGGAKLSTIGTVANHGSSKPLSIVPVRIEGPNGCRKTYALMDSGANCTIIEESLAADLGIKGERILHKFTGVGGATHEESAQRVTLKLKGDFRGSREYEITGATTVKKIGIQPYTLNTEELKKKFPYLKRAKIACMKNAVARIIIGEDNPHLTVHREILERKLDEPLAKRTKLGWVFAGKRIGDENKNNINIINHVSLENLDKMLKESFSLSACGIQTKGESLQDKKALQILEKTTRKIPEEYRWECGLLWNSEDTVFPGSRREALQRLHQNEKRMKKDENYSALFHKKMEENLEKEYIRKLTPDEVKDISPKTLYLPHFGVYNVHKPGKIRIVHDAAAKCSGVSLNDKLLPGPDLIRSLAGVLMNFRIHNVVITGDIEEMFNRVKVIHEDQQSQRFLWRTLKEADEGLEPDTYIMQVLLFGAASSPCTAIYVKDRNAAEYAVEYPEAVRAIKEDFYIDDALTGGKTVADTIKLQQEIVKVNKLGGFRVHKWLSNYKEVLEAIQPEERATGAKNLGSMSAIPSERVLGLWWCPDKDCFMFSADLMKKKPDMECHNRPTKREILSAVMSLFDPIGFLNNLKVKGMMMLQKTWISGLDWDDEVPDSIHEDWKMWIENLRLIDKIRIPRIYCQDIHKAELVELHTFMDASEEAYCAVSYLRVKMEEKFMVSFVTSKVRVKPLKRITIPRLELLAATLGAEMAAMIEKELHLKVNRRVFWSDSKLVLQWIRSETLRYKEFVGNRVGLVRELTNPTEWRWISTKYNVADGATRMSSQLDFGENSIWYNGPDFLHVGESEWPSEEKAEVDVCEFQDELKCNVIFVNQAQCSNVGDGEIGVRMNRFSSFTRLIRAQAAVLKCAHYWKEKCITKKTDAEGPFLKKEEEGRTTVTSHYTTETMQRAETIILKMCQGESYPEEIRSLKKTGKVNQKSSLWKLSPIMDVDGVIRVEGRITAASGIQDTTKQPAILPSRHHITELIVLQEHKRNAHQSQEAIMNKLRERYWVVDGRSAIRRICRQCTECRIWKAKPVIPKMGNLPHYRLAVGELPFTHTGVDFFGPIEVTVARHHEKRWGAVFCCMVTRAIHLEVANGLSTDEMMMVLDRFISVRGRPRHFYSDNGTNFVGSDHELKKSWKDIDWSIIINSEKMFEIDWHRIPSYGAHFGGLWERMVQSVKKILRRTLKERYPKDQVLHTVLKGAENLINSRPITYVSGDPTDSESLTPNHFLRGSSFIGPTIPGTYEVSDEILRKNWRRAQFLVDKIWERFSKEYIPELNRRRKWFDDCKPIEVGDLVLMLDEAQPRNMWIRAVVTATFPGKDDQVRVVEVTTREFGTNKVHTYRRSVDKVCPIGLNIKD